MSRQYHHQNTNQVARGTPAVSLGGSTTACKGKIAGVSLLFLQTTVFHPVTLIPQLKHPSAVDMRRSARFLVILKGLHFASSYGTLFA